MILEINPKILNPVYIPFMQSETRIQIFFGGSSSGKSYFIAGRVVLDTLKGRNTLVLRNVAKTLRGSCWNEITKAIRAFGLGNLFEVSKTEMIITAKNNQCQILFAGLDDVEKIKSITPAKGVLTDVWIEEATETAWEDYKQLDKRLRGLSRYAKRLTLSFNPIYREHWIYTNFFGDWDESKTVINTPALSILKTTYLDNNFLTQDDRDALENEKDPYYRNVYTLGNWGVLGDVIFKNWEVQDLTERKKIASNLKLGLDFGFSSDPFGAIKVDYDRARKTIYVLDEMYERGLTNTQLAGILSEFTGNQYITCDSAEPKSIQELKNHGIRALGAKKGPDSVVFGIQWLQGCKIIIDTSCQHTKNELQLYQWRKDRDGNSMRVPEDRNNHLIDALRYAMEAEATARYAGIRSRSEIGM